MLLSIVSDIMRDCEHDPECLKLIKSDIQSEEPKPLIVIVFGASVGALE